ncbi:MAG: hypothetical protein E7Z85_03980 [Methanosphaera stadtmanae]|nr:hypothetical protein [Methanosphaera stadtmanae]
MSNRETIGFEADEVEAGRLSIFDCEYPNEVEDELGHSEFDSRGYIIKPERNWNRNNNHHNKRNSGENNNEKTCCGICFLFFIIFWIYCVITYNPGI